MGKGPHQPELDQAVERTGLVAALGYPRMPLQCVEARVESESELVKFLSQGAPQLQPSFVIVVVASNLTDLITLSSFRIVVCPMTHNDGLKLPKHIHRPNVPLSIPLTSGST